MKHKFIHLNNHTNYSLLEGMLRVENLIELCHLYKMPAVAITDANNMFGVLEFSKAMIDNGIQPLIGTKITIKYKQKAGYLVLLAINQDGYHNLIKLSSMSYLNPADSHETCLDLEQLSCLSKNLICLTGGTKGLIGQLAQNYVSQDQLEQVTEKLNKIFPNNLYIELQRHNMEWEKQLEPLFLTLSKKYQLPLVATNACIFSYPQQEEAAQILSCIRYNSFDPKDVNLNAQYYFKSQEEMVELFSDIPEAIKNTIKIAQRCSAYVETNPPMLPKFANNENEELINQAQKGLDARLTTLFKSNNNTLPCPSQNNSIKNHSQYEMYYKRLKYELSIIIKMQFAGYFLIVAEFVQWAKDHNIAVGPGRGSGAGSLVAWALFITEINPIPFGLIFERFLNPDRISIPDFDIDFCPESRDKIISHVGEKYGNDHIAQIVTFGTLQARMVLRDVGRVLGIAYKIIDQICKMLPITQTQQINLSDLLRDDSKLNYMMQEDDQIKKLIMIAQQLEGLYRHASIHAAGVIIADRPLQEIVPLYKDQDTNTVATQFNMKATEQSGLVKFDFLGLKTLTIIQTTKELAGITHQNMNELPFDDLKVYHQIFCSGLTAGIFQFESPGMTGATKKIHPEKIEEIIAILALYRPGPMSNIPTYIDVKFGRKKIENLHPSINEIITETYGIIIYQEQVMQIAQKFAGFTLSQADTLRYAMGKKVKAIMSKQKEHFLIGAQKQGRDQATTEKVFNFIEKFAEYGFNKSHSTAYAIIAYQTAWLKTYYPCEFVTAFLQSELQNESKLYLFLNEMHQWNLKLLGPNINLSEENFSLDKNNNISNHEIAENYIRFGFMSIKGIGQELATRIVKERKQNGKYTNLSNFITRIPNIKKNQILPLIITGTFDDLYQNRGQLYHGYELLLKQQKNNRNLFEFGADNNATIEDQLSKQPSWNIKDQVIQEVKLLGIYTGPHPIRKLITYSSQIGMSSFINIINLENNHNQAIFVMGLIIAVDQKFSYKSKKVISFIKLYDFKQVLEVVTKDEINKYQVGDVIICSLEKIYNYASMIRSWTIEKYLSSKKNITIITNQQQTLKQLKQELFKQDSEEIPLEEANTTIKLQYKGQEFVLQKKILLNTSLITKLIELPNIEIKLK